MIQERMGNQAEDLPVIDPNRNKGGPVVISPEPEGGKGIPSPCHIGKYGQTGLFRNLPVIKNIIQGSVNDCMLRAKDKIPLGIHHMDIGSTAKYLPADNLRKAGGQAGGCDGPHYISIMCDRNPIKNNGLT